MGRRDSVAEGMGQSGSDTGSARQVRWRTLLLIRGWAPRGRRRARRAPPQWPWSSAGTGGSKRNGTSHSSSSRVWAGRWYECRYRESDGVGQGTCRAWRPPVGEAQVTAVPSTARAAPKTISNRYDARGTWIPTFPRSLRSAVKPGRRLRRDDGAKAVPASAGRRSAMGGTGTEALTEWFVFSALCAVGFYGTVCWPVSIHSPTVAALQSVFLGPHPAHFL